MKYVKVMFGLTSVANSEFKYKLGEVTEVDNLDESASSGKDFGEINFSTEDKILRCFIEEIRYMMLKYQMMIK